VNRRFSVRGRARIIEASGMSASRFPHLPPGRNPGRQTLRTRVSFPFWEAAAGLVCLFWAYSHRRRRRPPSLRLRLRGATLTVDREEARRGEELSVTLTLARPHREQVEVGIVCIELYDYAARAQTRAAPIVVRQTREGTAHQEWRPIERAAGDRTFTFELPRDAPYSYEGECVSYARRVSARVVRKLRADARLDRPVWVLP
jgi:hypothetical protein